MLLELQDHLHTPSRGSESSPWPHTESWLVQLRHLLLADGTRVPACRRPGHKASLQAGTILELLQHLCRLQAPTLACCLPAGSSNICLFAVQMSGGFRPALPSGPPCQVLASCHCPHDDLGPRGAAERMRCPKQCSATPRCDPSDPAAPAFNSIPKQGSEKTLGGGVSKRYQQSLWAVVGGPARGFNARQAASAGAPESEQPGASTTTLPTQVHSN